MNCIIFGAMPVTDKMRCYCKNAELIIAADAGYKNAQALGLFPQLCVGDYDTAPTPQGNVEQLPCEKDDTDTHYAAKRAVALGATSVTLLGATGGRLDHTLANMHTLQYLEKCGVQAVMADENTQIHILLPGKYAFKRLQNCYASLFPLGDSAAGVTLEGFAYPLQNATLHAGEPIGISNEFCGETGSVAVEKGGLVVVFCAKQEQCGLPLCIMEYRQIW